MISLDEFLTMPDVSDITEEVDVSKRLGKFKIKAMSAEDFADYQKKCTTGRVTKKGMNFDSTKFNLLIVAGQTIEPDFNNAEFLKKAGCTSAIDFIQRKLKVGEITTLSQKIQAISGFDEDINDNVEEAKN